MDEIQFLETLQPLGIRVWVESEKLCFRVAGSRGLPQEIREELLARKPRLIKLLSRVQSKVRSKPALTALLPRPQLLAPSFAQQRLWFLDRLQPGMPTYNVFDTLDIPNAIDVTALQHAVNELVRRHEVLRTTFPSVNGVPVQRIAPFRPMVLEVTDLSSLSAQELGPELERRKRDWACMLFDLAEGPLFKVAVLRLHTERYLWMLAIHHIVSDDWSKKLLDQELEANYTAYREGKRSPLPELKVQWADFTEWQHAWMQGEVLEQYIQYWSRQLAGEIPTLRLPGSRERRHTPRGKNGRFVFSRELSVKLRSFADQEGATLFMVMLTAYAVLLSAYSQQDDIIIGSPISDRDDVETEKLIGFLLNTLPLRVKVDPALTFRELLAQVRDTCIDAYAHQTVPYESLMGKLQVDHNLSGNPLFSAMLVVLNTPPVQRSSSPLWGKRPDWDGTFGTIHDTGIGTFVDEPSNDTTKFDISVTLTDYPTAIHGHVEYDCDIFDRLPITAFVEQLQWLLYSAIEDPACRIDELDAVGLKNRASILETFSKGQLIPLEASCVHEFVERNAKTHPAHVAIESQGEMVTYAELERRAERLARTLRQLGAGPQKHVAILIDRSILLFQSILAVLKTGAAYVPMDATYPKERFIAMLEDTEPVLLLTNRQLASLVPSSYKGSALLVDGDLTEPPEADRDTIPSKPQGEDVACILYTSGSTGRPKGVELTHAALVNYAEGGVRDYAVELGDRILQFASIAFDASLEETLIAFSKGATLVLRTDAALDSTRAFVDYCRRMQLNVLMLPTAYWHELVADLATLQLPQSVRCVVIGGERALPEKLAQWQAQTGGQIDLFNTYGPTEGTIAVTRYLCPAQASKDSAPREVSLGRPVANTTVYVLNPKMAPVPYGIPGELYLGGIAVARGYLNQPDLTAERFVHDPFGSTPGARLYRTGDVVRLLPDDTLEFIGRFDEQIKMRGYRVEPQETEHALQKLETVDEAVVVARKNDAGETRLVAYVHLTRLPGGAKADLDPEELRQHVAALLPGYMVPVAYVTVDQFPITSNGKVDRKALPEPSADAYATHKYETPMGEVETAIADVWMNVLNIERVGRHDDFFSLGGHSLLSLNVVRELYKRNLVVTVRDLFNYRTIAQLAQAANSLDLHGRSSGEDEPAGDFDPPPTIARVRDNGWPIKEFHTSLLLEVPAGLDGSCLAKALQAVIDFHDMFRLQLIISSEQGWRLRVRLPGSVDASTCLRQLDVRTLDDTAELNLLIGEYETVVNELDPQAGDILRVLWFDHGPSIPGALGLIAHHLIMDGVSWDIFASDLRSAYTDIYRGDSPRLGEKGTSYRRWSHLLIKEAVSEKRVKELSYWSSVMEGRQGLVSGAFVDGDTTEQSGALTICMPVSFTTRLVAQAATRYSADVNGLLLASLTVATGVWKQSRGEDSFPLTVDVNGHGREEIAKAVDLSRTIGWFTTLYPVRLDIAGIDHQNAESIIQRVRTQLRAAPDNGIGYGLLRYLNPDAGRALKALGRPQVSFNYLGGGGRQSAGTWTPKIVSPQSGNAVEVTSGSTRSKAPWPLEHIVWATVQLVETSAGPELRGTVGWAARLLKEEEVRNLTELWLATLAKFVDYGGASISH